MFKHPEKTTGKKGLPGNRNSHETTAGLARKLNRKIRLSGLALTIERVWPRIWPPFGVISLFLLVSLAGIWPLLPDWLHKGLLGLFVLAIFVSLFPLIRVKLPNKTEALRRLEKKSDVEHRPASAYYDTLSPAKVTKSTERLWGAHRDRMARLFARMRAGWPRPRVDRFDPYALRALLILSLVVSFLVAGNSSWDRLSSAFRFASAQAIKDLRIDAWITPPLYTGKPPILLADGARSLGVDESEMRLTEVPENSVLIIRVNGAKRTSPGIILRNHSKGSSESLKPSKNVSGKDVVEYKTKISDPASIMVQSNRKTMFGWSFNIIPDEVPKIELTKSPARTARGAIKLSYKVQDDYGVVEAKVKFDRPKDPEPAAGDGGDKGKVTGKVKPLGEPPVLPIALPRANAKIAEGHSYKDLTSHPWAGLPVIMTLEAQDQAGQVGISKPVEFVLPARKFTKPLAKAIVEQRRKLVSDPSKGKKVSDALDALTIAPDKFFKDKSVYLGLRSARWRLQYDESREAVQATVDQLWDIALRVEDGDLSDAERELKMAQEKLQQALQENASDAVIKQRMDELKQALSKFLQALARKAEQQPLAQMPNNMNGSQMISPKDLEQMLKNIENLAKTGSKDMAQQMLSQLQDLLENLRTGMTQQNKQAQKMQKMMQNLGDIIKRQQELLDDTFKARRQGEKMRQGEGTRKDGQSQRQGRGQQPGEQPGMRRGDPGQGQRQGMRPGEGRMPGMRPRQGQGQLGQGRQGREGQGEQFSRRPDQEGQGQQPGNRPGGRYGALSKRQNQLSDSLEKMLEDFRSFGMKPPDRLGSAGDAMDDAEQAIDQENLGSATQQQTLALDRLRQGAQKLMQQMMQSMQMQMGMQPNSRDPLGRPRKTQGPDLGTSVKVPDQIDIQRAREILEELRRKLGEPTRPALELDYFERLLKRF